MKLPLASPEFAQAYAIAHALELPGLTIKDVGIPAPARRDAFNVKLAAQAVAILSWDEDKRLRMLDQARAEYLADRQNAVKEIRERLAKAREPEVVVSKVDPELVAKIRISL